ncbi:MAG: DUF448 domain-containing protein [Candidatus Electrothrix sp. ATG1]|nr:DUF448 domain-containing protein [Candidatus Electrothrix sp. ATG1]MCI5209199.1 DUF448 domain-containing protein [Candidatus Electrothrix sp. ATG2]
MKRGHVPIRTCKGCGRKAGKNELVRLVWREGALLEDLDGRMSGRGLYSCRDEQCRNRLTRQKKMLRRAFRLHG